MSLVLDVLAVLLCSGELGKEVCLVLCNTSSVQGESFFFFLLLVEVAGRPGAAPVPSCPLGCKYCWMSARAFLAECSATEICSIVQLLLKLLTLAESAQLQKQTWPSV